jgi:hypothetical protein
VKNIDGGPNVYHKPKNFDLASRVASFEYGTLLQHARMVCNNDFAVSVAGDITSSFDVESADEYFRISSSETIENFPPNLSSPDPNVVIHLTEAV